MNLRAAAAACASLAVFGCEAAPAPESRAVFVLFDASRSYAEHKMATLEGAAEIVRGLGPGDRFVFQKIGACSFAPENVLIDTELPLRPDLKARAQLALVEDIDQLKRRIRAEDFTDITGALWEVARQRAAPGAGPAVVVIFSDLDEDLARSECRDGRDAPPDLSGLSIVLADIGELAEDRDDPARYFARIDAMRDRLIAAGANDVEVSAGSNAQLRRVVGDLLATPAHGEGQGA